MDVELKKARSVANLIATGNKSARNYASYANHKGRGDVIGVEVDATHRCRRSSDQTSYNSRNLVDEVARTGHGHLLLHFPTAQTTLFLTSFALLSSQLNHERT